MLVEKVAELTGRHLERDGIELLEAGGCKEMPHVMSIFGENGFGMQVSVLIDEDAEAYTARSLGVQVNNLASKAVYVSRIDLEDEYVSAIGAAKLWDKLGESSLFSPEVLQTCAITDDASIPDEDQLASFCRHKRNKIACAVIASETLTKDSAEKVSSVIEVLQNDVH